MSTLTQVVARFYVASIRQFAGQTAEGWAKPAPRVEAELRVVSANKPGNADWASATPFGEMKMTIGNPDAAAWFTEMLGEDVEIIIRKRNPEETAAG